VQILVKHRGSHGTTGTRDVLPTHPFDVVGRPYSYTSDVSDLEPMTGLVHRPPPVHQVFDGHDLVIWSGRGPGR
jgi:homogentisate 1,2-dioxygenase